MTNLRIYGPRTPISSTVVQRIEKAFACALDRFAHAIRQGQLTLRDVNGPRGGLDKQCVVQLRLFPRGVVVARGVGPSFGAAADSACQKIASSVVRHMSRKRRSSKRVSLRDLPSTVAVDNA